MEAYDHRLEVRWSDLDPNYHVKHSVYYDYGAYSRVSFLNENGITPELMLQHNIGPILFREECVFKKELRFSDEITVNLRLDKVTPDMSRWTMIHELFKSRDVLAAMITVDGAWIDTRIRKLTIPPEMFRTAFDRMVRTEGFVCL